MQRKPAPSEEEDILVNEEDIEWTTPRWTIPEEYWAQFTRIQTAIEEEENERFGKEKRFRCTSCGRYMSLEKTYLQIPLCGKVHVKEECIEQAVQKVRQEYPDWNWEKEFK